MQIIHREKKKTHLVCKGLWSPAVSQLAAKMVDEPLSNSPLAGPTNYEERTKVVLRSHGATAVKIFRFAPSVRRSRAQKGLLNRVRNLVV